MNSFETLVREISINKKEPKDFLNGFFTKENFKEYSIPSDAGIDELKAIKTMFTSKKDLLTRVDLALKKDPLCLEAFFTYFVLSEDVYVNYRFEVYHKEADSYADFSEYQKRSYLRILRFYIEFLIDIHNISTAIRVQRTIIRLNGHADTDMIDNLAYMYYLIEDGDEFYRLYLNEEFDTYAYLLLLVTLIKNDEKYKAKQVLEDMFKTIEPAQYLDHLWDLEKDNKQHQDFYKAVENAYEELSSVPDFFTWVNIIKEGKEDL